MNRVHPLLVLSAGLLLLLQCNLSTAEDEARAAHAAAALNIMPVDQVSVGMKGYGLTVFEGTRIEPFDVEVVTVVEDSTPRRPVIWILCPQPRLKESGPVQGMSGSPIYLWDDDEPQVPGRGGRLIGAFAFGYMGSNDCYAGVQPIEMMIAVGGRAAAEQDDEQGRAQAMRRGPSPIDAMRRMLEYAESHDVARFHRWRARTLLQLTEHGRAEQMAPEGVSFDKAPDAPPYRPTVKSASNIDDAPPRLAAGQPMLLPVAVSSPGLARLSAPWFEAAGMCPTVAPAAGEVSGRPPAWLDPRAVKLQPGSVLAIPLGWGDMDLAASGTVTAVLPGAAGDPDRVLGFGHAMFGMGQAQLPMATGFVHFIVAHPTFGSFKLGGSAQIKGAIVRDEYSAVAGMYDVDFETAPVTVEVTDAAAQTETFNYTVLRHKMLTPGIAGIVTGRSVNAMHFTPMESTLYMKARLDFDGQRTLAINEIMPFGSGIDVYFALGSIMSILAGNEYDPVLLKSLDVKTKVEEGVDLISLLSGRIDRAEFEPGDTVRITLRLRKYGDEAFHKHIDFELPADLKDGKYDLIICDAQTYAGRTFANRPHLLSNDNVDELFSAVERLIAFESDVLYVMLNLPDQGLALGQHELPKLPSSRLAMIATPTSTVPRLYRRSVDKKVPIDGLTMGNLVFKIVVSRNPAGSQ